MVVAALVTIVSEILKAFAYDVSVQLSVCLLYTSEYGDDDEELFELAMHDRQYRDYKSGLGTLQLLDFFFRVSVFGHRRILGTLQVQVLIMIYPII